MLLKDKIAVIYGAGGAIGGAVARTFAREGARLFLAGRSEPKLLRVDEVANVAALMTSDRASGVTGTVINISCGAVAD